jgi:cobalt/nickel transport system permease protein
MINFPVAGGTSGHLLGGALAAITLGPWAAMIVMTSVIGVQALIFQDGGLVVMGANIFNMGLMTALIGYGLYRGVAGARRSVRLPIAGLAAWLSVMAGALGTALQLWLSGTALLRVVVPAMLGVHTLIGIGEALITVAALSFVWRVRPDLVEAQQVTGAGCRGWIAAGLAAAFTTVLLSPVASIHPDGLERVAADLGFIGRAHPLFYKILPDYTLPAIANSSFSTILAGLLGVLVVAALTVLLLRAIRRGTGPERLVNAPESDAS